MAQLRAQSLTSDGQTAHRVLLWADQLRANKKLPHALCFSGIDYGKKKSIALALAQDLLCERQLESACGACGACLRAEKKQSEFLLLIEPEKEQIKIAETKKIIEFLSLSTNGKARVVIIDQAHLLNANSANSILKTIEEPQVEVYFILLTVDEKNLMPTMRSRVQIVRFHAEDFEQIINQRFPETDLELARQSADLLFLFWTDQGFLRSDAWREDVKDRERAIKILRYWIALGRNSLVSGVGHQLIPFAQWDRFLRSAISPEFKTAFSEFLNAAVRVEAEIHRNIDPSLAFEALWIKHVAPVAALRGSLHV